MQLYYVCSPMVKDLLRMITPSEAGVPPALTEQRLDESRVDGESVWMVQSTAPRDDAVGLVQPTPERMGTMKEANEPASRWTC